MTDRLVSFVDFPATALSLAGADIPDILQGKPFLGRTISEPRRFVFGARSRADDMFEVSRSVFDGRYLYVRHFLPHLPYIQASVIFDDRKASFRELRKLHRAGRLNEYAERLWAPRKPTEELYDLLADPHELNNLADSKNLAQRKQQLADALRGWILEHRDSGFLPEAEYQIRAAEAELTPFDVVQDEGRYDLESTLQAAWRVGDTKISPLELIAGLKHDEAGVRYWSAVACGVSLRFAREDKTGPTNLDAYAAALTDALTDSSPSVRIAAAEALLSGGQLEDDVRSKALDTIGRVLRDRRPWVALEAASGLARLGKEARPLTPAMKEVINRNRSAPGSRRPYKNFNYASFTGWALETALLQCGEREFVAAINAT